MRKYSAIVNQPEPSMSTTEPHNVIIMGAGGRDFHNFLQAFKNNSFYRVKAFTAKPIPGIPKRVFPKELAGPLYSEDIPIIPEDQLEDFVKDCKIDEVVLAYSDLSHKDVMQKASRVLASGADFRLMGPCSTMLKSKKPVIAVCAVRTGVGKSPCTRKVAQILKSCGKKCVVVRHPIPYGTVTFQEVQRFASLEDLDKYKCTIEEREEYEGNLEDQTVVYAGIDYEKILREAEKEADVIIWDGGNNDFPFFKPDLLITLADPHRPGHEVSFYPGETTAMMADIIIITKVDTATPEDVRKVRDNVRQINPNAKIIRAGSTITVEFSESIKSKRVLCIEDGPTLTHGSMKYGVAILAALKHGATIIDASQYAVGSIRDSYKKYPHLSEVLPAMGYSKEQLKEMEDTIEKADCDLVMCGTPVNLTSILKVSKPLARVAFEYHDNGELETEIRRFVETIK